MAPPSVTPSPHRFITPKSTNPTPRPSSSLRFQQQQPQPPLPPSQFASAPRFNFSSSQRPALENATPATQYSSPLSRRPYLPTPVSVKHREDIEETGSKHEDVTTREGEPPRFALPTLPTSKRRRPNPTEEPIIISSSPSPSPPTTPPLPTIEYDDQIPPSAFYSTATTHQPPRFVLPNPASSTTQPTIPNRPPLILPPRSPSPPLEPPAFFSPHRRGQKYIPGGLASTAREWIVETAQVAYGRKSAQELWEVSFRVGECSVGDVGVGMVLARERHEGGKWVLVGKGRGDGEVGVGCMVGIREPTWKVEIESEIWRVGVEWKVLHG